MRNQATGLTDKARRSDAPRALLQVYHLMNQHFGDLAWWPAESAAEVIIGAILVQNVAWRNVTSAIRALQSNGFLTFQALHTARLEQIEPLIRSTLYYRMKAKKLKSFAQHLAVHHHGDLDRMLNQPMAELRHELLSVYGIGDETADAILLYAAKHPSFVIDAYTKRIFHRLGFIVPGISYRGLQTWFMAHLPHDTALFNQYHAALVAIGHHYCAERAPACGQCPLRNLCDHAKRHPLTEEVPHSL